MTQRYDIALINDINKKTFHSEGLFYPL